MFILNRPRIFVDTSRRWRSVPTGSGGLTTNGEERKRSWRLRRHLQALDTKESLRATASFSASRGCPCCQPCRYAMYRLHMAARYELESFALPRLR